MRLAYLTNTYPAASHSFIRRELREIERRGHHVMRLSIRESPSPLLNPMDIEERAKTTYFLKGPVLSRAFAILCTLARHPLLSFRTCLFAVAVGIRTRHVILRPLAYFLEAAYFAHLLWKERIDHVHVHFGTNPAAVARLIRRLGGPGYSLTIHGAEEFDSPVSLDLAGKVADARFVIAISDFCSSQLRRWSRAQDWTKIVVVRCTVSKEFFDGAIPIPLDSRTLLNIGRLSPEKGQLMLVEAMRRLIQRGDDARLIIAGDGPLRPVLEKRVRDLKLTDRIQMAGWVSEAQCRHHLAHSRALVQPSFAEGMPVVIMEALAMGRPVISTYVAGVPELIRPGENGWLVPAGNIDLLADAMSDVLRTPCSSLERMGQKGGALVRQMHCTQTEGQKLEALLLAHTRTSVA